MPLDPAKEQRIRDEAKRRGVDENKAVAEATRITDAKAAAAPSASSEPAAAPSGEGARPIADKLLIGFLPFVKVRELRSLWLGLPDSIPDDDLTCGEYAAKHGGPAAATPAEPAA